MCQRINSEDFLIDNRTLAEDLIHELKQIGFKTYFFNLHYAERDPTDVKLCLIKTPRHALAWYTEGDSTVRIEILYRLVEYQKERSYKARDLLNRFVQACRKAGAKEITLVAREFGLTPRLPFRQNLTAFDPDYSPTLNDRELREFYSSFGFVVRTRNQMCLKFSG